MLFRLFVCITCILIASNHLFLFSFNTLILSLCEQAHLPTVLKSRLFFCFAPHMAQICCGKIIVLLVVITLAVCLR